MPVPYVGITRFRFGGSTLRLNGHPYGHLIIYKIEQPDKQFSMIVDNVDQFYMKNWAV